MNRNLAELARKEYDLLVVGGGIYGVCIAWDAALRGLSVALVEKGDFGHATSSNSLRVIHGGLRYLQHGDVRRVRRSIGERTAFMRIAPHLVHPLPILIPTYGHLLQGKEILSLAIFINKIVGWDRKCAAGGYNELLEGRVISKQECLRLFPGAYEKGLTGGAIVYDCQMSNSERLALAFARSANQIGAELANYVEATEFLINRGRVHGIKARDMLTDDELIIPARVVVNASGPWMQKVVGAGMNRSQDFALSKAFNLLINRELISHRAVGVYGRNAFQDRDALLNKGSRLFFITPWHGRSLIGTAHLPYKGDPSNFKVAEAEVQSFIDEINGAYPSAALRLGDVDHVYSGLLPVVERGGVQLVRHHRLYDHQRDDGIDGLVSVRGVKFTEARYVAEKVVDMVFQKLGSKPAKSMTAVTPLHGGRIDNFEKFLGEETRKRSRELSADLAKLLIRQYGSAYANVIAYGNNRPEAGSAALDICSITKAEVLHGIREEMAQKLADIVFRRTSLALPDRLTEKSLKNAAAVMALELGWNEDRVRREIGEVRATSLRNALMRAEAA
ncbi:MAG TPA: glycerol-3-phosphate dehydrogenase/oxidase [Candidatus Binatia bacterium]